VYQIRRFSFFFLFDECDNLHSHEITSRTIVTISYSQNPIQSKEQKREEKKREIQRLFIETFTFD